MGKCKDCGTDIDDRYEYCINCYKKKQQGAKQDSNKELIKALGAINNNLYCIRRQGAISLRESFNIEIVWSKKQKDFIEKEMK